MADRNRRAKRRRYGRPFELMLMGCGRSDYGECFRFGQCEELSRFGARNHRALGLTPISKAGSGQWHSMVLWTHYVGAGKCRMNYTNLNIKT